ncbi:MAG TPA: ATP-binding protein [Anaeromyxobacter sp.]
MPEVRTAQIRMTSAVRAAGVTAVVVGGFHLCAWLAGTAARWSASGAITMKTNSALGITLAGSALLVLGPAARRGWQRWAGVAASALVLLIGALTLGEHLLHRDLGLDQLLATEPVGAVATASPNRMGIPASSSLSLIGLGLLALAWRRTRPVAPYLGVATFFINLVPAVGYLLGVVAFYGRERTRIAWPTVVALQVLGLGLTLAHRSGGPAAALLRRDAGGTFLRRVLPWTVLVPLALGFLRLQGERRGLYDATAGTGALVIALVLFFSLFLWRGAANLSHAVAKQGQANEALLDSEQKYATIFRRSPLPKAWTKLPESTLADVNDAWVAWTGIPREEAIGKTTVELGLLVAEDWSRFHGHLLAHGSAAEEVTFVTRARGPRTALARAEVVTLAGVRYMLGVLQDVTEQKRTQQALRENEERARARALELQTVLDAVPAAVWIARDPRGDRIDANGFGAELLRRRPDQNVSLTAPGEDRPLHYHVERGGRTLRPDELPLQSAARGQASLNTEIDLVFDDGAVRHLLGSAVPLLDGEGRPVGSVGAFIDVSERKAAEEGLRESDRRKSEFLAVLSHELRNPLAPIRNAIYILDRADATSEQAARARDIMRRQTAHLVRMVDDLLDVMRISRGTVQLKRQRLDLADAVREATDDLRPVFERSGVELRVEHSGGTTWVDADPTRLAQVLGNLLQNSVKFCPSGGTVCVSTAAAGGSARFRIKDSGIGIATGLLEQIFEPFAQADQGLARTSGGLGLGLHLVKSLVELHGGTVSASSEGAGRGAEFVVSLPLAESDPRPAQAWRVASGGEVRDVVVIEDDADAAEALADVLGLLGHRVRVARDGRSGLALARERMPDVILCDIGLPDMDGYEVARTVRGVGSARGTRLVALTGYAQPEDRQRALEAGFDAHLAKPPDPEALARALAG